MIFTTLIEPEELHTLLLNEKVSGRKSLLLLDVSCSIVEPEIGAKTYAKEHIPSAVFMNFDEYVTGKVERGTGRHPLPDRQTFRKAMEQFGASQKKQIVIYDQGGLGFSSRLWYELRWLGLENAAVLNGGLRGWKAKNLPTTDKAEIVKVPGDIPDLPELEVPVSMDTIQKNLQTHEYLLVDARPAQRFHGIGETIDHKAGHIPGAVSRPGSECFDENGSYKSAHELRKEFLALLGDRKPNKVINMCGSGVAASINLLAMAYCGLYGSHLYPGSFSQWIDYDENPITEN